MDATLVDAGLSLLCPLGTQQCAGMGPVSTDNWRAGEGDLGCNTRDAGLSLLCPLGAQQYAGVGPVSADSWREGESEPG